MKLEHLKAVRVGVSLLFLVVTTFLFVDFAGIIPPEIVGGITYLQFAPSLVKFLQGVSLAAGGFLVVLLLALVFGRVYCSTICPLGTFQDIISYIARKRHRYRWYRRRPPSTLLRYSLLGITVLLFIAGSGFLVTLLDPFSNYGRVIAALLRPAVTGLNNGISHLGDLVRFYALYRVPLAGYTWLSVGFAVTVLGVVSVLSYRHGRLYCNTICPVGSLLGLVSKLSLFRIAIADEACIGCGLCVRVCKSSCIDADARTVDLTRCVDCFNCFSACPTDGMVISRAPWLQKKAVPVEADSVRRGILLGSLVALTGMRAFAQEEKKIVAARPTTIPEKKEHPVAPPGAQSIQHFTSRCTACHLCVSACPSRVLAPSFLQYGIGGILQPHMSYEAGYCNFECTVCGRICPTGAITPLTVDQKKVAQLGVAKFIKESCVVETDGTDCGACSEHCPTKAVTMVPYKGKLVIPEVKSEYCVGCGACEHACPTRPYRAIYVDGNPVHTVAKKKEEKKIEEKPAFEGDFPF